MYATTTDPLDDVAQETIAQLTALAAATITADMFHYDEATLTDHLRSAVSSRPVIDQAIGIVNQHCTPTLPSTPSAPSPNTANIQAATCEDGQLVLLLAFPDGCRGTQAFGCGRVSSRTSPRSPR
jgi:hypothetical protein